MHGASGGRLSVEALSGFVSAGPEGGCLLTQLANLSGQAFLQALVAGLRRAAGVQFAFVGELSGARRDMVETLVVATQAEGLVDNFSYDLEGSPCAEVVSRRECVFPRGVADIFPRDRLLADMGVEGYVGVALVDEAGIPLGLLVLLSQSPLATTNVLSELLTYFEGRVAVALMERRYRAGLTSVALPLGDERGNDPLAELSERLAQAVHVDVVRVWVGDDTEGRGRSGASGGEQPILSAPQKAAFREGRLHIIGAAGIEFPAGHPRACQDVHTYAALRIDDPHGGALGLIEVLHHCGFSESLLGNPLFSAFVSRIEAELRRDRAERRRVAVEARLVQSQKLESLGLLAGGVAHDFNNILLGIQGNCSLAIRQAPDDSPLRAYLEDIDVATQRAADLADQMLAYSGKGRFVVRTLDVNDLVRETVLLAQASISKNVRVHIDVCEDALPVRCDGTQVRQVVMNLILNGSEATTGPGGRVRLTTGRQDIDAAYLRTVTLGQDVGEGTYVFVEVSDNGCGMHPDTVAMIFDPFYTTKFTGRGLGLAAVQGIVRGHLGALRVYSEVGEGTSVRLLFPEGRETSSRLNPVASSDVEWKGRGLVLVVDDEPALCRAMSRMLELMGFEVLTAPDGVAALGLYRRRAAQMAVVLLDMTMPGLSGEQVFREMRVIDPKVPVILMSGYNEQDATSRFAGEGLAGFLQKPFRYDALLDMVRSAVSVPLGS
ncbi:MAG: response regulator [Nannocystaceae bacterium]